MNAPTAVLDRLSTLADATRSRILLVLERHELTVGELCAVLEMPQSTVSRHLRLLSDEGWVVSRQEGTSRYYALPLALDDAASRLWRVVSEELVASDIARRDRDRMGGVLARRRTASAAFFNTSAEQWDALRAGLYGERTDLLALAGLFDPAWRVGDLGCGTGRLAAVIAPHVRSVIAVDASAAMLDAARERLREQGNVTVRQGELESLPVEAGSLDVALLSLVLHHAAAPPRVFAEAHRVLREGGRLLVVDLLPHDRAEYRQKMGHVWLGFSVEQLTAWLAPAGFTQVRHTTLPRDGEAQGPPLFALTAVRGSPRPPAPHYPDAG